MNVCNVTTVAVNVCFKWENEGHFSVHAELHLLLQQ